MGDAKTVVGEPAGNVVGGVVGEVKLFDSDTVCGVEAVVRAEVDADRPRLLNGGLDGEIEFVPLPDTKGWEAELAADPGVTTPEEMAPEGLTEDTMLCKLLSELVLTGPAGLDSEAPVVLDTSPPETCNVDPADFL